MSKHSERRARRAAYHRMLDAELSQERRFVDRAIRTLNDDGVDVAPDGNPMRADFTARPGLSLVERAINSVRVRCR